MTRFRFQVYVLVYEGDRFEKVACFVSSADALVYASGIFYKDDSVDVVSIYDERLMKMIWTNGQWSDENDKEG